MIVEHVMLHWPHVVSLNVGFSLSMFACWIATHLHLLVFSSNYMIICAPSGFPTLIPTHAIFYFRCASECDLWTGEQPVQPASDATECNVKIFSPLRGLWVIFNKCMRVLGSLHFRFGCWMQFSTARSPPTINFVSLFGLITLQWSSKWD